LKCLQRRVNS